MYGSKLSVIHATTMQTNAVRRVQWLIMHEVSEVAIEVDTDL
jgi:hypothetical protein